MPVLPEVASRIVRSGVSRPVASPSRIIRAAARSLTDPPGFCHSALAYSSTPGVSRSNWCSRTSGVRPIMSRTDEPGARSRSDVVSEEDIWISDRLSPDFINLGNPVKLAAHSVPNQIPTSRPASAAGSSATGRRFRSPSPLAILMLPGGHRRPRSIVLVAAGVAVTIARRAAAPLGRPPHRRDLADAQRAPRAAGGQRPVRAGPQPAVRRQHRDLGRLCADRGAAAVAGADHPRAARPRVSRDRAVGGTRCSSRASARPIATTPRACRDGSRTFNRETRSRVTRLSALRPLRAEVNRSRGARRCSASAGRFVAIAAGYLLLWLKARS